MVSLREKYPLESRKPLKKTLSRVWSIFLAIIFVVLAIILLIPFEEFNLFISRALMILVVVVIFILVSVLIYIYEIFYMKYYFYDAVSKTLVIKKGVFSKNAIYLQFNRLQDVYVDQDIFDRMFGLYDLHVSSATYTSGWLSHIDGLNKENSEIIKKLLLKSMNKDGEH